jgi:hypothetical protein
MTKEALAHKVKQDLKDHSSMSLKFLDMSEAAGKSSGPGKHIFRMHHGIT